MFAVHGRSHDCANAWSQTPTTCDTRKTSCSATSILFLHEAMRPLGVSPSPKGETNVKTVSQFVEVVYHNQTGAAKTHRQVRPSTFWCFSAESTRQEHPRFARIGVPPPAGSPPLVQMPATQQLADVLQSSSLMRLEWGYRASASWLSPMPQQRHRYPAPAEFKTP